MLALLGSEIALQRTYYGLGQFTSCQAGAWQGLLGLSALVHISITCKRPPASISSQRASARRYSSARGRDKKKQRKSYWRGASMSMSSSARGCPVASTTSSCRCRRYMLFVAPRNLHVMKHTFCDFCCQCDAVQCQLVPAKHRPDIRVVGQPS